MPTPAGLRLIAAPAATIAAAFALATGALFAAPPLAAQGTAADYTRAEALRRSWDGLVVDAADPANWVGSSSRFWYRKSVKGGNAFVLVNAATLEKRAAFDHAAVAASLATATARPVTAVTLPFNAFTYSADGAAIDFTIDTTRWTCTIAESKCARVQPAGRGGRGGGGGGNRFGGGLYGDAPVPNPAPRTSPDGKWDAAIRNYNIFIRASGSRDWAALSADGSEANAYVINSISWSPNSRMLAAYRVKPGFKREVHYVTSSPEDQIQPKSWSRLYNKPGDVLEVAQPVLFDVATRKQTEVSNALFPNAYTVSALAWRADGRAVTFEYNQRGHQAFRVIEVNAASGAVRAIVNEESATFFEYSAKLFRQDLGDGAESRTR
jgi:hypothetical protein